MEEKLSRRNSGLVKTRKSGLEHTIEERFYCPTFKLHFTFSTKSTDNKKQCECAVFVCCFAELEFRIEHFRYPLLDLPFKFLVIGLMCT
jgi:hypothetical protein